MVTKALEISKRKVPKRKKAVNYAQKSRPSSELAFDRAITILFNQDLNEPISTFFIKIFERKDISDMIHPELFEPSSDLFYKFKNSHLNQLEKDLLSTLYICNRDFIKFYGSPPNENWSNVSTEQFDNIGEEYGFVPINRNIIQTSPSNEIQHVTNKVLKQQLDEPIVTSLLENENKEVFDKTSPNVLTEQQFNNNPNFCETTNPRSTQQKDALFIHHVRKSNDVLKNTRADNIVPLGNQYICIKYLPPHYDDKLFMGSIPPDKSYVSLEVKTLKSIVLQSESDTSTSPFIETYRCLKATKPTLD